MENKEFVKNYIRVENTKNIPWNWPCRLFGHHPSCRHCDPNCETELLIKKKIKTDWFFIPEREWDCWCFSLLICVCVRDRERKEGPHCVCVCVCVWASVCASHCACMKEREREKVSSLRLCVCASERVCEWLCVWANVCGSKHCWQWSSKGKGEKRMKISSKAE